MNKICQLLGTNCPIVHEPIHTLTDGKLVAAISESGALGILGINAGYKVRSDATSSASISNSNKIGTISNNSLLDAMTERNLMNEQIDQTLSNTFRSFGVEIASTSSNPEDDHRATELVELMRKRRLTIALFEGFGRVASKAWVNLLHNSGIKIMQVINNINNIRAAQSNGIDILICKSNIELANFVHQAGKTPVLAGYDTTDSHVLKDALRKGAQGVFLKTVFALAKEAPTSPIIKDKIINAQAQELISFKMNSRTIYSLSGKLPQKLAKLTQDNEDGKQIFTAADGYQGLINGMAEGNLEIGYTDIAADSYNIKTIKTAHQIIAELTNNN